MRKEGSHMSIVERSGEELAHFIDRRKFLKRAAIAIFSFTAASAVNLDRVLNASASSYCPYYPGISSHCQCQPINNNYCENFTWGSCNGANCSGHCTPNTGAWPNTGGCWCTEICLDGCNDAYIKCCDCYCGNGNYCTCSQLVIVSANPEC